MLRRPNEQEVYKQMNTMIEDLIGSGLCVDQNFPSLKKEKNNACTISINTTISSAIMKNIPYRDAYYEMKKTRSFHVCLIDQALLLMQYEFHKGVLSKSRLMYMPNPDLIEFQNNEALYLDDTYELYADIIDRRIVTFPIRLDYDQSSAESVEHPAAHVTLGQYENCRIPLTAPMTPFHFVGFITRNFYNTKQHRYEEQLTRFKASFEDTITPLERAIVHVQLPN